MLGSSLTELWKDKFDVYGTDVSDPVDNIHHPFLKFDLLSESYEELIKWSKPDVIVHCAALTNVDFCESNKELTMQVNAHSVEKLLRHKVKLIFISSDAVFPDQVNMANEQDSTNPQTVYGASKVLGEKYILEAGANHCAVRTTIVGLNIDHSKQGFVEWIINSVKKNEPISLFDDVLFTPISIWQLADELSWVIKNDISGAIHIAGKNPISKLDFGILLAKKLNESTASISAASVDGFNFKAVRSKDQTLDSALYESISNRSVPSPDEVCEQLAQHYRTYRND